MVNLIIKVYVEVVQVSYFVLTVSEHSYFESLCRSFYIILTLFASVLFYAYVIGIKLLENVYEKN